MKLSKSTDTKETKKIVIDEYTLPKELEIFDEAYTYFEETPVFLELRADIANRFAYLGNFLTDRGEESKSNLLCCDNEDNINDLLLTIINTCIYKRKKYVNTWDCKTHIFLKHFKTCTEIKEWVISGRCISCQKKAFNKNNSLQGNILTKSYECHKVHGKKSVDSYDLFYTYVTRLININQLHFCEDTDCCYPKDKSNLFELNVNTYKDIVLNNECVCGSTKKYKHCCYKKL